MRQSSLSTSSSEQSLPEQWNGRGRFRRRVLFILLWTIVALVLIDAAVGFAFRLPNDPLAAPSSLQMYFDYGRSIEGKLQHDVGATPEQDASILKAGWLAQECDVATSPPPGRLDFDIYGMSFSNHIADHMERLDPGLASRRFAGPGAPPNHSYACFIRRVEAGNNLASVQILGVLASSMRRMETLSGLTTSFEAPQPFTYPRYSLASDGRLVGHLPTITTQDELRTALADSAKWAAFLDDLAANDTFYAKQIVRADIFDHSVIARMIRRAWGQRILRERTTALQAAGEISGKWAIAPVLRAMLIDFSNKARRAGKRPIVILIEDRGYGGTLSDMAAPVLHANNIDFVSTSMIVPPDDTANFLADGHFTPVADEKIARAVLALLGRVPLDTVCTPGPCRTH
jgi:hypothetical protein